MKVKVEKSLQLTSEIWQVKWNKKGDIIGACTSDKEIKFWKYHDFSFIEGLDEHTRAVRSIDFSYSDMLASASFDASIMIWKYADTSYEYISTLEGHESEVKCVSWCNVAPLLATCSRDRSVWIWEYDDDDDFQCIAVLQEHIQDVKFVKWHPNKELLASASYDNSIKLYTDADGDWECFQTLTGHSSTVWSLSFNSDGNLMCSVGDDKSIRIWKADGDHFYKCISLVENLHSRPIYCVDWSPIHNLIVTGSGDNSINVLKWDNNDYSVTLVGKCENAHSADINAVEWNPSVEFSNHFCSCADDGKIIEWSVDLENMF
jgi:WD40 repeat protein